ncbi:hypothetical protein TPA0908_24520 [Micromonospora sp. AKA38]|nr:hypothetical protein TPA0908_24520 [Micromonospora sp. AKA38]
MVAKIHSASSPVTGPMTSAVSLARIGQSRVFNQTSPGKGSLGGAGSGRQVDGHDAGTRPGRLGQDT